MVQPYLYMMRHFIISCDYYPIWCDYFFKDATFKVSGLSFLHVDQERTVEMEDMEKLLYKLGLIDLFLAFAGEKITPDIVGQLTVV